MAGKKQASKASKGSAVGVAKAPARKAGFGTIEGAIEDFRAGRMVVVVDDEDRENEGDLTMAAEKVTPETINFMVAHGRGLVCVPLTGERLDELRLGPMVTDNTSPFSTAFTVSVDAKGRGVTTGISAHDRCETIRALLDPATRPEDLSTPGHTFPLRAREGGVLTRAGQTEAAVDLARLAGLYPAGVICEIMKDDGTMARVPDLLKYAARHRLRLITVRDLIEFRMRREKFVTRVATTQVPTALGRFRAILYHSRVDNRHHLALVMGEIGPSDPVLVRVHGECLLGDALGSVRCACGSLLRRSLEMVAKEGRGVVLYIRQGPRGLGLLNEIKQYELEDQGMAPPDPRPGQHLGRVMDLREYGIGAQILVDLGVRKIRLMTNNPRRIVGLEGYDLHLVDRVALPVEGEGGSPVDLTSLPG
jgi:3,4-dihydroxy 2-butanone 4-phosphate synthase/GTP cyclohydrolase II